MRTLSPLIYREGSGWTRGNRWYYAALPPATLWWMLPTITLLCPVNTGGAWLPLLTVILEVKLMWYIRSTFSLRSLTIPDLGSFFFDTSGPITNRQHSMKFLYQQVIT